MKRNRDTIRKKPQVVEEKGLHVNVPHPDQFEKAMRRFKRKVEQSGILRECRVRQEYVKPSEQRKVAKAQARSRWLRKQKQLETL